MKREVVGIMGTALAVMLGVGNVRAQCCGDCSGDGTVTVNEILIAVNHALTSCSDDGICSNASCPAQLAACQTDLANCRAQPAGQRFPASGQTTSHGPGSDGEVQAGAPLSYTDNGDGTVTDNNTGLMWEKKDQAAGGIHNVNNVYTWGTPHLLIMNSTIVTEFLATLNRAPCFAGHCDWRIPNVKELQSIVDYEVPIGPRVNAAFNTNCVAGCANDGNGGPMCSCTAASAYWSSTAAHFFNTRNAWDVSFGSGSVNSQPVGLDETSNGAAVRAVRGGL